MLDLAFETTSITTERRGACVTVDILVKVNKRMMSINFLSSILDHASLVRVCAPGET